MNRDDEIIRALGRIEGELVEIRKVTERVRRLEVWIAVLAACVYVCGRG
jgi:hypothetical protein